MLAVDKNGQWQPFYYTQEDGRWTPEKNFREEPVEKACIKCHCSPSGKFSPIPHFLKTPPDFEKVGYRLDTEVIEALLDYVEPRRPWLRFWK